LLKLNNNNGKKKTLNNLKNMNIPLKILLKSIITTFGLLIIFFYFFFEEKNESSKIKNEEKSRNTNFTKITKSFYNFYIFIVISFLIALFFLPEGLIEKPEPEHAIVKANLRKDFSSLQEENFNN
jgi:hypothetical protein